ncbi:MAG TPA: gliding motility lipoprotein GldD [Bacteroidales bacterium]|nr:gliding motility lipoprotein GldD [Bacteroidales bacterium]
MNKVLKLLFLMAISATAILYACSNGADTPKPKGYLRTDFETKSYTILKGQYPYTFEYPTYGIVEKDTLKNAEPYWITINFKSYNSQLHLSYKKINKNLSLYIEDARKMAYKHTIKADAIDEILVKRDSVKVYGIIYDIKGNTATSLQFFLTDSNRHFLRGSLYFKNEPNKDSLAPSIEYFRKDVEHLINTLKWE